MYPTKIWWVKDEKIFVIFVLSNVEPRSRDFSRKFQYNKSNEFSFFFVLKYHFGQLYVYTYVCVCALYISKTN